MRKVVGREREVEQGLQGRAGGRCGEEWKKPPARLRRNAAASSASTSASATGRHLVRNRLRDRPPPLVVSSHNLPLSSAAAPPRPPVPPPAPLPLPVLLRSPPPASSTLPRLHDRSSPRLRLTAVARPRSPPQPAAVARPRLVASATGRRSSAPRLALPPQPVAASSATASAANHRRSSAPRLASPRLHDQSPPRPRPTAATRPRLASPRLRDRPPPLIRARLRLSSARADELLHPHSHHSLQPSRWEQTDLTVRETFLPGLLCLASSPSTPVSSTSLRCRPGVTDPARSWADLVPPRS
uniref:Uncharacterized protein n=1 Tax=Oryza sativa subsp. japonica TaxID=39947 RepID=Q6Z545_ORYSJ|nr:hypothetical protein [Oryza sativa Japonica Group]BAC99715.1 hypothetical protein [Oryza sativa Japonica Group]